MPGANAQILSNSSETLYRLAEHAGDYRRAHAFLDEQGEDSKGLSFPTILAIQDDEVVGLMSTIPRKDMILAGPLVVKKDRPRAITALRLIELYDTTMTNIGVSTYSIWIPRADERFKQMVERSGGFEWIAENFDGFLYARRLTRENA